MFSRTSATPPQAPERIAIYPGSFDPVTLGHMDIVQRAVPSCDHLIVAIGRNASKAPLFSVPERLAMLQKVLEPFPHVSVDTFEGSLVAYARRQKAARLVRGVRNWQDWLDEAPMMAVNFCLGWGLRTQLHSANPALLGVSSSLARRLAESHQSLDGCVSEHVAQRLAARFPATASPIDDDNSIGDPASRIAQPVEAQTERTEQGRGAVAKSP